MARFESESGDGRLRVPGVYAALLAREREHQAQHDRFAEQHPEYGRARDWRLLDALELGRPAILQGRRLGGRGVPKVPLRRELAFRWYTVSADDRVVPAESLEDEAD